jgi:PIN domain nuclease of toxin-antitoxin system
LGCLLDAHALLWWLAGDDALSVPAQAAIIEAANDIFVSAASVCEIATKHWLGKLPGVSAIAANLERVFVELGFIGLPITLSHGQMAGAFPGIHRDTFDRMLIAQAMPETLSLVLNEAIFDGYGARRLW